MGSQVGHWRNVQALYRRVSQNSLCVRRPYLFVSPLSFNVLLNAGQNTYVAVNEDIVVVNIVKERVTQHDALPRMGEQLECSVRPGLTNGNTTTGRVGVGRPWCGRIYQRKRQITNYNARTRDRCLFRTFVSHTA